MRQNQYNMKMIEIEAKLTRRGLGASNLKARIIFEPAKPASTLTPPTLRHTPTQLEILLQLRAHRPPIELLKRPPLRHRHIRHTPARRRHPRGREVLFHGHNRRIPRAQTRQHHVGTHGHLVVVRHALIGAIKDAVA